MARTGDRLGNDSARGGVRRWRATLLLAVVVAVPAVIGCSRVRDQFPDRRFNRPYKPTPAAEPYAAPVVRQSTVNHVALGGLPEGVKLTFLRDHPEAAVSSVQHVPSGTGPMLYRITYIEGGIAQQATYHATGDDLNGPPEVIVRTRS
jgi:hypothetical protein